MVLIGAHVRGDDPVAAAAAVGADSVQLFLADPQGWKKPVPREDAESLVASGLGLYAHAPYLVNVASTNNRIRIPSRKMIEQHAAAAAALGARGLVVHGGHVGDGDDIAVGVDNWRKTFARAEFPVRILVENTAGGENACARTLDRLALLWDAIGEYDVGLCLDTCHAWAAGEDLETVVERVRAITGRVDLVHANGSRDPHGSSRDRHASFAGGQIPPELIAHVVREAACDVVVETPAEGQADDIAFLRAALAD
ncbi:deoxyribonuclease IV [Cellulomonas sp. ATA003]|uniref:deoxyribonuclease IV n=1 Tax=Cellulomonas sp. ATA003 TaxID=3073064 RepID=UPI0028733404|nr:deoxyribonuclease IV [Cellulomonas sp. ATA003]WNB86941.1 deoxyribonuclease IV [Cellulomonas sp. ATA003]